MKQFFSSLTRIFTQSLWKTLFRDKQGNYRLFAFYYTVTITWFVIQSIKESSMINEGNYETKILNDGWTAVTKDKKLSAQFEHTIGITDKGYEIFTSSKKGLDFPPYKT